MEFSEFQEKVLERSKELPVIVDFWAPWCGPCQMLGPVIEELASEAQGKWELLKVNTDESPEISGKYGIRGIPAVKMYSGAEVIAEFTGALPKYQIQKWLDDNIPDDRLKDLEDIIQKGETNLLENFVAANPDLEQAKLRLAEIYLRQNPSKADEIIKSVKPDPKYIEQVGTIRQIIDFINCDGPDNGPAANHLKLAKEGFRNGNFDLTLDELIKAVMIDKMFCDELPRKTAIAFFRLLGPDHEITKKYRRRFDMALY